MLLGMNGLRRNVPESVAQLTGGEYYPFSNARNMENSLLTISKTMCRIDMSLAFSRHLRIRVFTLSSCD
jgi:hypothetical protein